MDDAVLHALSDRYRLERELGTGGSATVYLAHDLRHRRQVAVKVLHRDLARAFGPERFQREIETTANLRHPHILPLFDSGEAAGTMYYVMPLVTGESLRSLIDRTGRLEVAVALRIIGDIADALNHAHERGIVHRDIKPENILIESGRAVVADFGIARASAAAGIERLTATGMSLGTPLYMSPEQAFGEESIDARSDQYSLACVLYEMLAGDAPFTGSNAMAIIVKHLQQPAPSIREARPDVPEHVASAIERALAKSPSDRFPGIAAWIDAVTCAPAASLSSTIRTAAPTTGVSPRNELSVAITQFVASAGDGELADAAGELTDILATGLALFPYLTVVRGDVERAEYVLTGRMRRSGAALRLSVSLVRRATKEQLWGESYDRPLPDGDPFSVIDNLADHVIAVVADPYGVLVRNFTDAVSRKAPDSLTPYEAVLLYYHYHHRPAPDTHLRARDALERAVERDPRNADAWASLTYLYLDEDRHAFNPRDDSLARALAAGRRAVDAGPTNANAHHALAEAHYFRGDLGGFRASSDRAIALNRRDGASVAMLGNLLASSGSFEKGVQLAQHAMSCNPFHPGWFLFGTFFDQYHRGALDDALATAQRINMPGYFFSLLVLAIAHAELGHVADTKQVRDELFALMPTIARDGPPLIEKWLRYQPELLAKFLKGMERAGIVTPDAASASPSAEDLRTLAVLPMVNTSGDPENEHFSDGLTDELIGALSAVESLRVAGRTSSFALKGKGLGIADVARTLGVSSILEGSVRKAGSRLKASVQLVDHDGKVLWSEAFDRTLTDVFEVQEEIARAVVRALRVRLDEGHRPLVRPPTSDLVAHDLYLKGRFVRRRFNPDDLRRAIEYFEQAVARDPNFAAAYAALATSYVSLAIGGDTPTLAVADKARAYAERAITLDERLAEAHHAMAYVHYSMELNVPAAVRDIRRALELDPGNVEAAQVYAVFLMTQRHFAEAERYATRSLESDPLMPLTLMTLGWIFQVSGKAARGVPMLREVLDIAPQLTFAREHLVHGLMMLGKHDEAVAEARHAAEVGGSRERALLGYVLAELGRREEAVAILDELLAPAPGRYVPPCHVAYVYAALGKVDDAIAWLERAFEEVDTHLNGLAIIRAYDSLRGDARFQALVARLRHAPPP